MIRLYSGCRNRKEKHVAWICKCRRIFIFFNFIKKENNLLAIILNNFFRTLIRLRAFIFFVELFQFFNTFYSEVSARFTPINGNTILIWWPRRSEWFGERILLKSFWFKGAGRGGRVGRQAFEGHAFVWSSNICLLLDVCKCLLTWHIFFRNPTIQTIQHKMPSKKNKIKTR